MLKAFAVLFPVLMWGGMPFSAHAFDMRRAEVLNYQVSWGPLSVGRAELMYMPEKSPESDGYSIRARVRDDSALLELDDVWQSRGHHQKTFFTPSTYEALQRENSYRADKLVSFDAKAKAVTYLNRRSEHDKIAPLAWDGAMRDPLSAVYAWRLDSVQEMRQPSTIEVMGVKRPFTLIKQAARRETFSYAGKKVDVWSVDLNTSVDGKLSKDSWTIKLRDDGRLTPIVVVARTKFGTFRATLEE